ncbi:MAG: hypothetical protein LUG19_09575 [Desulfovibrio sp.]|uniref:hypothetical protein n=1 Tax=Desulfovibrio sp. TaxID=885 RepID=UPI00258F9CB1|nr:hypothetical protein [Desulfovibrio sp.]MCD7984482.1 hypothetical protein [Desulfovibrio sp.]
MEINTEQLEALLRQQEQQATTARRQTGRSGGFDAILAQQLGGGAEQANAAGGLLPPGAAQAGLISQMLLNGAEQSQAADPDAEILQEAFTQASGTLDLWDSYAKTLGSSADGGSLRDAYALLEGIDSQVAQLKQGTAGVRGKNPGFDSLLNELEVMTATEKFKFNRGDYNV